MRQLGRLGLLVGGIAVLLLLAAKPQASAAAWVGEAPWRRVAFAGTDVYAVAASADGRVLYVSTSVGLHTSMDGGGSWLCAGSYLESIGAPLVVALVADTEGRGRAYAGTSAGPAAGLYATDDYGQTWRQVLTVQEGAAVAALDLDASEPPTLSVLVTAPDGQQAMLLVSRTGGETWQKAPADVRHSAACPEPACPRAESHAAHLCSGDGLFVSVEEGTWRKASNGWPPSKASFLPSSSAPVCPATPGDLLQYDAREGIWRRVQGPALTACQSYASSVLASSASADGTLVHYVATRSVCGSEPARVFALVPAVGDLAARSSDAGASVPRWRPLDLPTRVPWVRLESDGGTLFALTSDGLWQRDGPRSASPTSEVPNTEGSAAQAIKESLNEGAAPESPTITRSPNPAAGLDTHEDHWLLLVFSTLLGAVALRVRKGR